MIADDDRVLVVGGGLTGLSCAVFLAWHGVACTLIEQHPDLVSQPRLRSVPASTMELYRQVGLESRIRDSSNDLSRARTFMAIRAQTLASAEYERIPPPKAEKAGATSPCSRVPIDQDKLELVLRAHADSLGVQVHFGTQLCGYTQSGDGVYALLRHQDETRSAVHARYLVAADGADSAVRRRYNANMEGPGTYFHLTTLLVEADLREALAGRTVHMAYLDRPRPHTFFMALDDVGKRWVFGTTDNPDSPLPSYDTAVSMVRAAAGLPFTSVRLRPQIPGTDVMALRFPVTAAVADSFRDERIFLIGDAAHPMPPTGGFGGAAGVQDAHNLAWKIAAVIKGHAGESLLDTYDAERRPVAIATMRQAVLRFHRRFGATDRDTNSETIVDRNSVMTGYTYRSSVISEPWVNAPVFENVSALNGKPGTKAPHVPLSSSLTNGSTIDLYGERFVVLTGPHDRDWFEAAASLPVAVDRYRLGVDVGRSDLPARHGIGPRGVLMVRPDGFVAFRSVGPSRHSAQRLHEALATALQR
ncbi:MAG TPA: FAD-dependent monooxygenase [Candidatus Stackebrandtia faecavium]|nr:FAD-dependent monooxygenase [Candidatus Stackebrandtia faecavium]